MLQVWKNEGGAGKVGLIFRVKEEGGKEKETKGMKVTFHIL